MALGTDLRVVAGALAGVGLGGVALLTALPALVSGDRARPAPLVAAPVVPEAVPAGEAVQAATPAPRFDTVRVAPDGSGLVAGQAVPGATVAVLAGEEVATEVTADADGRFVAFLDLPPSAEPRALSLRDEDGTISEETVLVAPTGGMVAGGGPLDQTEVASTEEQQAGPAMDDGTDGAGIGDATSTGPTAAGEAASPSQPTGDLAQAGGAAPSGVGSDGAPAGAGDPVALAEGSDAEGLGPAGAPAEVDPGGRTALLGERGAAAPAPALGAGDFPEGVAPAPDAASAGFHDDGPATAGAAPAPSIAVAVAGPDAASPDLPPEQGPAPEVAGGPEGLSPPENGTPGQAAVLLSDSAGVRVLQPALAPGADAEVLSTVALDAIAYGGEGEVTLSGRASEAGAVRLYLDNAPVAEVPVGPDGAWSTTLSGTEPGDYTLRVDQIDAAGGVVSRIETPFRREARVALAAAMAQAQQPGQTIAVRTVQPGNTLWAIARDRYGEPMMYVRVFELNRDRIRDPDLIYPGQVFVLPATDGR